jgi:hypothetical protein
VTIEKAIENHLKTHAGLKALVSSRIYPDSEMEANKTYPVMIYQLISSVDDHALGTDPDSREERWQFTIKATSASSRAAVSKQLKAAFKDFSGLMGGESGLSIHSVLQQGRRDTYDSETKIFLRMEDFMFIYDDI